MHFFGVGEGGQIRWIMGDVQVAYNIRAVNPVHSGHHLVNVNSSSVNMYVFQ